MAKFEDRQQKISCAGRIFFARKSEFPKESDKTVPLISFLLFYKHAYFRPVFHPKRTNNDAFLQIFLMLFFL
jgi:hypothetical protein